MHHICAPTLGSETAYEILASQKCTQVYREQNVIRHLNIPDVYRDLYLEQSKLFSNGRKNRNLFSNIKEYKNRSWVHRKMYSQRCQPNNQVKVDVPGLPLK